MASQFASITKTIPAQQGEAMVPTSCLILEEFADGGFVSIPVAQFEAMFGQGPYTHAGLSAVSSQASAGWQKHFDAWKAQGLIS